LPDINARKENKILDIDSGDEKMGNPKMHELNRFASFLDMGSLLACAIPLFI
jgi:hypothetical protein